MRQWILFLAAALIGCLAAPPVLASHTTSTNLEIDLGEAFDLLQRRGELVDVAANPAGILEIKAGGKTTVEAKCLRIGKTAVTLRYSAGGEVHTAIINVTCKEKER